MPKFFRPYWFNIFDVDVDVPDGWLMLWRAAVELEQPKLTNDRVGNKFIDDMLWDAVEEELDEVA